jgi:hypothetical protein
MDDCCLYAFVLSWSLTRRDREEKDACAMKPSNRKAATTTA